MNEQPKHGAPAGESGQYLIDSLSAQYEAAWQAVQEGQEVPNLEAFLTSIAVPERPGLEKRLRLIAADYEQRQRGPQPTLAQETGTLAGFETPAARLTEFAIGSPLDQEPAGTAFDSPTPSTTDAPVSVSQAQTLEFDTRDSEASEGADEFAGTVSFEQGSDPRPQGASPTLGEVGTPDHPRPTVAGYEILGVLGRGGMGVVYKARQSGLNRVVALKMVLAGAHAGQHQLARFQAEAEAVAKLDHPNIVHIYEIGENEGLPFFSLEFVQGGSLSEAIAGKPRPPSQAAELLEQLALAMDLAHRHGIIHRDLKSANVLLTPEGTPKITDFGLAKSLESDTELTATGTLMGTPSYMSPEQARGDTRAIGTLSDLYSLGAILYELLTGRPPFLAPSMLEVLYQVRNQEPVPPRHLQPRVPKDLETICLKCLQKEPEKRYADCKELAEDLHRFRTGEAIRARPVGKLERAWRWCRRNPRTAVLSSAIGLLLCAFVVSLAVVGVRLNRDREAVAQTRQVATERIEQAESAIRGGNYRRAQELLSWPDPLLDTRPELQDVRAQRGTLGAQVKVYARFEQLLDDARFNCRFGSVTEKEQGQQICRELLKLYDDIEQRQGYAAEGLPPWSQDQQLRFREDAFDAFLVAAKVERELAANRGPDDQSRAAREAVALFNRAEQILPDRHILHILRAECWKKLGDPAAEAADMEKARTIRAGPPTMAVDRFWRGLADHMRGEEARQKGDPEKAADSSFRKAVAEYAAYVQERPDDFWGYFNWAVCLVSLRDYDNAAIGFTTCIRIRPDFPWPYNNRGVVHHRQNRNDQAVRDYTSALGINPTYVEAWENRGIAHSILGNTQQAIDDFSQAIALNTKSVDVYNGRAELFLARKQFLEAIRDCDQAIGLKKSNPQGYFLRAVAHQHLQNYLKARDDYSEMIKLTPERAPAVAVAYGNRATVNWNLKEFDDALKDAARATQLDQKDAQPCRLIASIHLGRGGYTEALEAIQKALERKPDFVEVIWARAQIYAWQGKSKEALGELDPLIERLAPDKPETLNLRGDVYRSLGKFENAETDYRRMIGLRPKDTNAYIGLALALEKQGKTEEARICFDQLIAADPDSPAAHLRRAEYHRDHKQFDLAHADCDQAAKLDPESALPELVRAGIEAAQGQYRSAIDRAEAALKKSPPHDGRALYAAACTWSLAAGAAKVKNGTLANEYAERAAQLLAEALDRGFHDLTFPEHNRMSADPALAPVRAHPKIRELLAGRP